MSDVEKEVYGEYDLFEVVRECLWVKECLVEVKEMVNCERRSYVVKVGLKVGLETGQGQQVTRGHQDYVF